MAVRGRMPILPFAFVLLLLVGSGAFFKLAFPYGGKISFASKLTLMIIVLIVSPFFVNFFLEGKSRIQAAIVQAFLSTFIIAGFSYWFVGSAGIGMWIVVLFSLLIVLIVGTEILNALQEKIEARLSNSKSYPLSTVEVRRLKESMEYHILLRSLPLGAMIATGYGWATGRNDAEILASIIPIILGIIILLLLFIMIVSANIMSKSLILFDPNAQKPSIVEASNRSFWRGLTTWIKIPVPVHTVSRQDHSQNLDMAYLVADLRKIYFFDAVHNSTLLLGFFFSLLSAASMKLITQNWVWVVLAGLLILFIFCYLPFSIGQYRLHETIIDSAKVEGLKRKELKKALAEASPLYPQLDFIGALLATGTVGGILAGLAYGVIINALK